MALVSFCRYPDPYRLKRIRPNDTDPDPKHWYWTKGTNFDIPFTGSCLSKVIFKFNLPTGILAHVV